MAVDDSANVKYKKLASGALMYCTKRHDNMGNASTNNFHKSAGDLEFGRADILRRIGLLV